MAKVAPGTDLRLSPTINLIRGGKMSKQRLGRYFYRHKLKMGITQITFLFFVVYLLFSVSAYAGLAVSVTGGDWAVGTIGMGVSSQTAADKWTVTNAGSETESIYIKADGVNWHPAAAAGDLQFVLKHDASGSWSEAITNTGNGIFLAGLLAGVTKAFGLQFTAPTASTAVTGAQSLTVTLTAAVWVCKIGRASCRERV